MLLCTPTVHPIAVMAATFPTAGHRHRVPAGACTLVAFAALVLQLGLPAVRGTEAAAGFPGQDAISFEKLKRGVCALVCDGE